MKRRDLFRLATGSVAAFLVGKYGPPKPLTPADVVVTIDGKRIEGFAAGTLVLWVPPELREYVDEGGLAKMKLDLDVVF